MISFDDKLQPLLGKKTADALETGLGLTTVGDLLRHYPRRYDERGKLTDIRSLEIDEHVTVGDILDRADRLDLVDHVFDGKAVARLVAEGKLPGLPDGAVEVIDHHNLQVRPRRESPRA